MSYSIKVTFTSPDGLDISFSDVIAPDDLSCVNYCDDIGEFISCFVAFSEKKLSKLFPHGHDYILSDVSCIFLEGSRE